MTGAPQAVLKPDSRGRLTPVIETEKVHAPIGIGDTTPINGTAGTGGAADNDAPASFAPTIQSVEEHTQEAEKLVAALKLELAPRADQRLQIPLLRMTEVK